MKIGGRYVHPKDGVIVIKRGQFMSNGRVSNFWYWTVEATGELKHGYGGNWPEAPRKSLDQLADEITAAENKYCFQVIEHVKSGGRYMICGAHYRESDMALCLEYTPCREHRHRVYFARSIDEMAFGTRFVFVGWPVVGNAELDGGAPNHLDHSKRGFEPK